MKANMVKNYKDIVEKWLKNHPPTRDSDTKLLANIWSEIMGVQALDILTARQLLQKMVDGELPSSETIRRTRQKLQEQNPELRGVSYIGRKSKGDMFRKEIVNI